MGGCLKVTDIWTALYLESFITTKENIYEEGEDKDDEEPQQQQQNKESQSIRQIAILDMLIFYQCQGNKCNNQTIAELVKKAVKDHYNLSEVYEVLNVEIEENSGENSESTTFSTEIDTTSPLPHSTTTKMSDMTTVKTHNTATATTNNPTASTTTSTAQQNNVATSLHMFIIITIINLLLFLYF